jgi:uncharacterized protein (TIGR03435 family)
MKTEVAENPTCGRFKVHLGCFWIPYRPPIAPYVRKASETLRKIVAVAYNVDAELVTGGPDWLDTDRFDIEAVPAQPVDATLSTSQEFRGVHEERRVSQYQCPCRLEPLLDEWRHG